MESKKIIVPIVIFLFFSTAFLIYRAENMPEPKWWSAYFVNAKDESLNFTIENHSDKKDFHWQIIADNKKLDEANIQVDKDDVKIIKIENNINKANKITVEIVSEGEKREIYKMLKSN